MTDLTSKELEIKPVRKNALSLAPTKLEIEMISLIASGMKSKEIAEVMRFTNQTVEDYRMRLCRKFGVKNSCQLVAHAFRKGLIS